MVSESFSAMAMKGNEQNVTTCPLVTIANQSTAGSASGRTGTCWGAAQVSAFVTGPSCGRTTNAVSRAVGLRSRRSTDRIASKPVATPCSARPLANGMSGRSGVPASRTQTRSTASARPRTRRVTHRAPAIGKKQSLAASAPKHRTALFQSGVSGPHAVPFAAVAGSRRRGKSSSMREQVEQSARAACDVHFLATRRPAARARTAHWVPGALGRHAQGMRRRASGSGKSPLRLLAQALRAMTT